jgi:t-SNARE complex subunit (syntaxin)
VESLVIAQEEKIITVEEASGEALNNLEEGTQTLDPTIDHARIRRRNQRRVLGITVVIMIVVVVIVVCIKEST